MNGWEIAGIAVGSVGVGALAGLCVGIKVLQMMCKGLEHIDG